MSGIQGVVRGWVGVLLVVALALPALPMTSVAAATTRTVDSLSDGPANAGDCTDAIAGNCTLRDAIAAALPNDTITFASGFSGTITLTASLGSLILAQNVTITGPGQASLFISGGCTTCAAGGTHSDGVRVFVVNSGVTATISGVTITRGRAGNGSGGGGILNHGSLTVTDSTISGSATGNGGNGGNGNAAATAAVSIPTARSRSPAARSAATAPAPAPMTTAVPATTVATGEASTITAPSP